MLVSGKYSFCHCYDVCKQGCSSSRIICNWSSCRILTCQCQHNDDIRNFGRLLKLELREVLHSTSHNARHTTMAHCLWLLVSLK